MDRSLGGRTKVVKLTAIRILEQDLKIKPTASPHPRQGNITGWPEAAAIKSRALELAKNARLHVRPETGAS